MRRSSNSAAPPARAVVVAFVALGALAFTAGAALAAGPRAEVQMNLCSDPKELAGALHLRPGGPPMEVWYFETAAREVFDRGAVLRLRLKGGKGQLTLKVADQDCAKVDQTLLRQGDGKCEYDLHGADLKGAVSLSQDLDEKTVRELLTGRLPLADVLGAAQIRYLREHTAAWPLPAGVAPRGPVRIAPYRADGKKFVVEIWELPAGQRYVEMSQKTAYADALRLRAALEAELARAGVVLCSDQSSQAGNKARDLVARP
jgi:hypothetical protein